MEGPHNETHVPVDAKTTKHGILPTEIWDEILAFALPAVYPSPCYDQQGEFEISGNFVPDNFGESRDNALLCLAKMCLVCKEWRNHIKRQLMAEGAKLLRLESGKAAGCLYSILSYLTTSLGMDGDEVAACSLGMAEARLIDGQDWYYHILKEANRALRHLSAPSSSELRARALLLKGEGLFLAGRYSDAAKELRASLALYPAGYSDAKFGRLWQCETAAAMATQLLVTVHLDFQPRDPEASTDYYHRVKSDSAVSRLIEPLARQEQINIDSFRGTFFLERDLDEQETRLEIDFDLSFDKAGIQDGNDVHITVWNLE